MDMVANARERGASSEAGFLEGLRLYIVGLGTAIIMGTIFMALVNDMNLLSIGLNLTVGSSILGLGLLSRTR